jgi:uncharacterized protein YjbJ (UPF0337 family)
MEFAPLSHRLIKGFFLIQGFFICWCPHAACPAYCNAAGQRIAHFSFLPSSIFYGAGTERMTYRGVISTANSLEAAMDGNRVEGGFRDVAGKVQDAVGGLAGDAATQVRGKINQATGQAQKAYGQAVDEARDFTTENPAVALVATFGLGMALGLLIARR